MVHFKASAISSLKTTEDSGVDKRCQGMRGMERALIRAARLSWCLRWRL